MSKRGGNSNTRSESLDIHLSRSELADILGLRQKSRFLRYMFVAMDQDKNGAIEFKELEKFFLTLSKKGKFFFLYLSSIFYKIKPFDYR